MTPGGERLDPAFPRESSSRWFSGFTINDHPRSASIHPLAKPVRVGPRTRFPATFAFIRARFCLDDGRERALVTIGARLGLIRERIRQLQQLASHKLGQMLEQPAAGTLAA